MGMRWANQMLRAKVCLLLITRVLMHSLLDLENARPLLLQARALNKGEKESSCTSPLGDCHRRPGAAGLSFFGVPFYFSAPSNMGSLAMLLAIRLASSIVGTLAMSGSALVSRP
jgi:hypothetical protein